MAFSLNKNVIKYNCIICVAGHSYWHPFGTPGNFENCCVCEAEIAQRVEVNFIEGYLSPAL